MFDSELNAFAARVAFCLSKLFDAKISRKDFSLEEMLFIEGGYFNCDTPSDLAYDIAIKRNAGAVPVEVEPCE